MLDSALLVLPEQLRVDRCLTVLLSDINFSCVEVMRGSAAIIRRCRQVKHQARFVAEDAISIEVV